MSQTESAFTSLGLLPALIFVPIVAEKPHIPLNAHRAAAGSAFLAGVCVPTWAVRRASAV
ncbi:exported hypothetical protein [Bradyrhizobium sp. ORS 285]|nr:exported hypothetical protein [Bradyrhizobium sp. ORS 285]